MLINNTTKDFYSNHDYSRNPWLCACSVMAIQYVIIKLIIDSYESSQNLSSNNHHYLAPKLRSVQGETKSESTITWQSSNQSSVNPLFVIYVRDFMLQVIFVNLWLKTIIMLTPMSPVKYIRPI